MRVHKKRSHYDHASTYASSTARERDDVSHLINNAFPPEESSPSLLPLWSLAKRELYIIFLY